VDTTASCRHFRSKNISTLLEVCTSYSLQASKALVCLVLEHLRWCSVCNRAKIFFTSKFSYLLFSNPSHNTETGIADRWGTTNIKPSGPIIMMGESEILRGSRIYLVHSFIHVYSITAPFTSKLQLCWAKTTFVSQTGIFWLSSSNVTVHPWRCSKISSASKRFVGIIS